MYKSPTPLPEKVRRKIASSLNERLVDGLDLHSQIKVAHWNIRGPLYATLHPLFETFAVSLATHNDSIAERAVTLGSSVSGTARYVAKHSALQDYPAGTTKDLDHVRLLADRIEKYLVGLRQTRDLGEKEDDVDSVDLLTSIITEFEKHVWFLRATLG